MRGSFFQERGNSLVAILTGAQHTEGLAFKTEPLCKVRLKGLQQGLFGLTHRQRRLGGNDSGQLNGPLDSQLRQAQLSCQPACDRFTPAEELTGQGVSVDVIDLRSLVPFDSEVVIDSAQRTGRVVVVQEAPRSAGFAAEVVAQIQEKALYSLNAPVERVTGYDIVVPLRRAEKHFVPSVARVVAAARRTLEA